MRSHFSSVRLCANLWTVAHQTSRSMGFSRQEYWSRLPCPPPGDLPTQGLKLCLLHLLHWQACSLPLMPPEKPLIICYGYIKSVDWLKKYGHLKNINSSNETGWDVFLVFKIHFKFIYKYFIVLSMFLISLFAVATSCLTLCDPMDCSMQGSPVLQYLLEFA